MLKKMPYLIAVIFLGVYPMADTYILIPAMTEMALALPDAGPTLLNFILTIPALMVIPASVLAGRLVASGYLSKKGCVLLGSSIFTLGGVLGGLVVDIRYILFTRAVLGFGNGFLSAMIVAIIVDYFTEKESGPVMGILCAASNILAIGLTVISGYLVLINWRYAFVVYLVGLLMIFYHARVLHKNPQPLKTDHDEIGEIGQAGSHSNEKTRLGPAIGSLLALAIISKTGGNTMYLALSYFIEGQNLGNAADTGLANGIMTMAVGAISFAFGFIYNRLGKNTSIVFYLLMGAGYLLLAKSFTFTTAALSLALWGLGSGLTVPYLLRESIARAPRHLITFAGALVNSTIYLSFVLSTFVPQAVIWLTNSDDPRMLFWVLGVILTSCGFLSAAFLLFKKITSAQSS